MRKLATSALAASQPLNLTRLGALIGPFDPFTRDDLSVPRGDGP
ncbi:MAG TPA: hypothetical protein VEJ84_22885 [Acidimicrobiales bacterium]|nr:hypothetical protein [Acidimicrobiales bacterium]